MRRSTCPISSLHGGRTSRGPGDPNAGGDAKPQWEKYSAASDHVLMITQTNSHMTTGYGAQTYPENMKNDCTLWDKINSYE